MSDWTDGLTMTSLAAIVLLYFACLAPAIAFGGLLEKYTHGDMGAMECIVSTFLCGTSYALFSGQPLLILGGTGPVAIFESLLFKVAEEYMGVPFLITRFWTGIWLSAMLAAYAVFDISFLIKFITRFTDEIFAGLISFIFIYEACNGLMYPLSISYDLPDGSDPDMLPEDTAADAEHDSGTLLSVLLGLGTFIVLILLRTFRKSKFLIPGLRRVLADFSPVIAIALMTFTDYCLNDVRTKKLLIPDNVEPSKDCRSWLVPLFSYGIEFAVYEGGLPLAEEFAGTAFYRANCTWNYIGESKALAEPLSTSPKSFTPGWVPVFTILPAILASILLFLDQNITARIINKPDNRLKKGAAYHLDMLVLAMLIFMCSALGLPWMCAATVRSINHLMSLAEKEEVVNSEGHKSEQIARVTETRVTGLCIHVLIGLSVFAVGALKFVPMAVLLGVFLTMGITSLTSIQLWDRVMLLFTEPSLYPPTSYVRQVPSKKIHLFTVIQLLGLASLFIVKRSPAALCFPLIILMMVPVRIYLLPKIFTERELAYLDSEEEVQDEEDKDGVEIVDL